MAKRVGQIAAKGRLFQVMCVAGVATKRFIAAIPRQHHLDVLAGQLGHAHRRDRRRIGKGLVVETESARQTTRSHRR